MFSGIIEELGRVTRAAGTQIEIAAGEVLAGVRVGDSIAVNGCCLTVAGLDRDRFTADVMPETLRRTTLGGLRQGDAVNLEASLRFGDRVGGHLVSGHVDATATVTAVLEDANARRVTLDAPEELLPLLAAQGSVALDGISLTVVDVFATALTVSLIPHTLAVTTAGAWAPGSRVNLEVDVVARHVARLLAGAARPQLAPMRV